MSLHSSHDDLLGLHLNLLEPTVKTQVNRHLDTCPKCQEALQELSKVVEESLPSVERHKHKPVPRWRRMMESMATPITVMLVSLALSLVLDWSFAEGALGPLLVGALLVVVWLHAVVARAEAGWRSTGDHSFGELLPGASFEDRVLFTKGVHLSVIRALSRARAQVSGVLVMAGALFIVSATATLAAGVWAPAVTSEVAEGRPFLLPGALAFGVILGGVIWASFRLVRLARAVRELTRTLAEEAGGWGREAGA